MLKKSNIKQKSKNRIGFREVTWSEDPRLAGAVWKRKSPDESPEYSTTKLFWKSLRIPKTIPGWNIFGPIRIITV